MKTNLNVYGIATNDTLFEQDMMTSDIIENDLNIAIYGNRKFTAIVPEKIQRIIDIAEQGELLEALEDISTGPQKLGYVTYYPDYKNMREAISDIAPEFENLNNHKVHQIRIALDNYNHYDKESEALCKLLTLAYGGTWTTGIIRGYSQGDWQHIVYDAESVSADYIEYVEAVYMGTGEEYAVVETEKTLESTDEIWEEYAEAEGYCTFLYGDAKKLLSEETGVPEENVHLYYVSGYTQVPRYSEV